VVVLLLRRGLASASTELKEGTEDLLEVRDVPNRGSLDGVLGEDCVSRGCIGLLGCNGLVVKVVGAMPDMPGG